MEAEQRLRVTVNDDFVCLELGEAGGFVNLFEGTKVDRDNVAAIVDCVIVGCDHVGTDFEGNIRRRFRVVGLAA